MTPIAQAKATALPIPATSGLSGAAVDPGAEQAVDQEERHDHRNDDDQEEQPFEIEGDGDRQRDEEGELRRGVAAACGAGSAREPLVGEEIEQGSGQHRQDQDRAFRPRQERGDEGVDRPDEADESEGDDDSRRQENAGRPSARDGQRTPSQARQAAVMQAVERKMRRQIVPDEDRQEMRRKHPSSSGVAIIGTSERHPDPPPAEARPGGRRRDARQQPRQRAAPAATTPASSSMIHGPCTTMTGPPGRSIANDRSSQSTASRMLARL